ncbi:putative guanine deaminase [Nostocoides japonicum T1-X7]|uniref:Putative guanine deaminase n=1 Tax=Nostocoides japonicum T1-X7 TaxID=1194083 RepID=A0A077M546_9MICO|nr:guanine deaminase [Tetrasphaera japonica]CCH79264.1 putative guanine deaminase [Tetrasphaera japonica T1-X7]
MIIRATVLDTPDDPFAGGVLRAEDDCGILVEQAGVIGERGPFASVRADHPEEEVVDLRDGVLLPGLVDTHVHFPQVRVIGGLGMPLLDWLDECALPEEVRLRDVDYAREVARDFMTGLVDAGTTTALVFGSHFAGAVDAMFEAADRWGLRITAGLVTSDRILPDPLLTTPERAYEETAGLAARWHGKGRLRYAVTPRFSLSASEGILEACAASLAALDGAWFTSHVNENLREIAEVGALFDGASYVDSYDRFGLLTVRSLLAHNVHPTDAELATLAARGSAVAHCPTSNAALGSGLFPLRRHVESGVHVALGSDVGAGTGFSMLKEGLQAYFLQRLLGEQGMPLTSTHLLWLATGAGARALGLAEEIGDLSVGKQLDAVWVTPEAGDPLAVGLANARCAEDALSKVFALGTTSDVGGVWVGGEPITARGGPSRTGREPVGIRRS